MKTRFVIFFALLFLAPPLAAQEKIETIEISELYTTHVVFAAEVIYVDRSNPLDVKAQVIDQNRNMIRLRASRPFSGTSSLSILESNGNLHTFYVAYKERPGELIIDITAKRRAAAAAAAAEQARINAEVAAAADAAAKAAKAEKGSRRKKRRGEEAALAEAVPVPVVSGVEVPVMDTAVVADAVVGVPAPAPVVVQPVPEYEYSEDRGRGPVGGNVAPTLNDVLDYRQTLHHIGIKEYGLQCMVENILVYNDVTYVVLSLKNDSAITYVGAMPGFTIESRKKARRDLPVSNDQIPRSHLGSLFAHAGETARMVYCFDKITLTREQVFRIYVYEDQGQRNFVLTLSASDINNAARYVQR